jgi:hypothetical protein
MHVERHARDGDVARDDFTIGVIGGVVGGARADGVPFRKNFAATWDGDRLVLETTWSGRPADAGTSSFHRDTWAIDGDGRLAITTTESLGLAAPATTTVRYRRQP